MISISHLCVSYITDYGTINPINDLSIEINCGDSIGIIGRSGAGKTTLIKALMGTASENMRVTGHIQIDDKSLFDHEIIERSSIVSQMTYIPQFTASALSPSHKLGQVFYDLYCSRCNKSTRKKTNLIYKECLQKLDLPEYIVHCYPHELSGGMLQRAIIAMITALPSALLILDEPTSALDGTSKDFLKKAITTTMKNPIMTTILISHEMDLIKDLCSSVLVIGKQTWWNGNYSEIPQHFIDEIGIM